MRILETVLKNQKLESLIAIVTIIACLIGEKVDWLGQTIENHLACAFDTNRLSLIVSAEAIILGIYITVISIIATSVIGITEDMLKKKRDCQLLQIVFTGMFANCALVFVCVLFDINVVWKAVVVCGLLAISIASFLKFMFLIFLIFKANFDTMGRVIDAEREGREELLTLLKRIESRLKK